jgi:Ser/Thr protein kinase RdoA (MazF antagonist)
MLPHQKVTYLPFLELNTIEAIATEFSLGKILAKPENNTSFNESFKLETETGTYQVKSYVKSVEDPEHFAPLIQREIDFTKYLEINKMPVQHHLGFQPFLYQGKLTTITTYLEGERLAAGLQSVEKIAEIGNLIAKLHIESTTYGTAGAAYEQRNSFRDRVESNLETIEKLLSLPNTDFKPLLDQYNELRELRQRNDLTIPRGLVHGEITFVHLIKHNGSYSILDFEGIKFVPFIFDFGQTLITMAYDGKVLHTDLVTAFLKSYQESRALTVKEKALIPSELIYNFLHKLEWRMTAMLNNPTYIDSVKNSILSARSFIDQVNALQID